MKLGHVAAAWVAVSLGVGFLVAGACGGVGQVGDGCDRPDIGHKGPNGILDQCHCQDPRDTASALAVGKLYPGACCACPSSSGLCGFGDPTSCCPLDDAGKATLCPDAGSTGDAEAPTGSCAGECLPNAPAFWTDPLLLWFGAEVDAPACPDVAPAVGYEGYADLTDGAATCGACACGEPVGSCELPVTLTANAATCPGSAPSTAHTPFDPASGWSGACDTNEPIPAGKLCAGAKCVQSVTIAPLTLTESCAPIAQPTPQDHPSIWATFARACTWTPRGTCASLGELCAPAGSPPPGFRACVGHEGDFECPTFGPYQEKHVFYGDVDDTRNCTPCACSAPVGSACSALISIYSDAACSVQIGSATPTNAAPGPCTDVPPGSSLGSKSAGPVAYNPGVCQPSGGEPMGSAEPTDPVTFCCLAVSSTG